MARGGQSLPAGMFVRKGRENQPGKRITDVPTVTVTLTVKQAQLAILALKRVRLVDLPYDELNVGRLARTALELQRALKEDA